MFIIGIDPGASGGVSIWNGTNATAAPLEENPVWLFDLLNEVKEKAAGEQITVLIERVGLHMAEMKSDEKIKPGDPENKGNLGIIYRLQTMIASHVQAVTIARICKLPVCPVAPRSWQTFLGLGNKIPGETVTDRKGRYRAYAKGIYPGINVTLKTQDAVCLMEFGRRKMQIEPAWFNGKLILPDKPELKLF